MAQCKAKNRRGERCKKQAMKGKEVCAQHGGKSLSGIHHPNFKHGRYSKSLTPRLLEIYDEKRGDTDLTSMLDEIALIDTKIQEVMTQNMTSASSWTLMQSMYKDLVLAIRTSDTLMIRETLTSMGSALDEGRQQAVAWNEVIRLIEVRRRLAESERRKVFEEYKALTIDKVMLLVAMIVGIVQRYVPDKVTQNAIGDEIRRLVTSGGGDS